MNNTEQISLTVGALPHSTQHLFTHIIHQHIIQTHYTYTRRSATGRARRNRLWSVGTAAACKGGTPPPSTCQRQWRLRPTVGRCRASWTLERSAVRPGRSGHWCCTSSPGTSPPCDHRRTSLAAWYPATAVGCTAVQPRASGSRCCRRDRPDPGSAWWARPPSGSWWSRACPPSGCAWRPTWASVRPAAAPRTASSGPGRPARARRRHTGVSAARLRPIGSWGPAAHLGRFLGTPTRES